MAKSTEAQPQWAKDFLAKLRPPTEEELKRRREAVERFFRIVSQADDDVSATG